MVQAQVPHCKLGFQFFPYFCDLDSIVVKALAYGGADPYTYMWSTGATTPTIVVPNDGQNVYCVTITGVNGCTMSNCISTAFGVTPSLYVTNPASCGLPVPIEVDWPQGIAPPNLTYTWSTGATTPTITATSTGVYSVTLTDSYGCTYTLVDSLVISPIPMPQITGPASLCSGQPVTLTVSGGPYDAYEWLPGGETTPSIVVTTPGTYSVTVWTSPGPCEGSDDITILPGGNIPAPVFSGPAFLCTGQTGTIQITNSSNYSGFLWSTGQTTSSIPVNQPGVYDVTVTNAAGCTSTGSFTVTGNNGSINLSANVSPNGFCVGADGSIDLSVSPSGNFTYVWSNGATTQDLSSLPAGTYTVTVTNDEVCTQSESFDVGSDLFPPILSNTPATALCGLSNGVINLSVAPSGVYTYFWSNGATTEDLTNVAAGFYQVTVTSSLTGCTSTSNIEVQMLLFIFNITGITTPATSCTSNNGSINITISPANPMGNFTFNWSNGATTEDLTNLASGTYTVTVTAGGTCTASAGFTVTGGGTPPTASATPIAATCSQNNGSVNLTVTPPGAYTYLWSNGETTQNLTNVPPERTTLRSLMRTVAQRLPAPR
ncbi:MAG: hypothetical protein IPJ82_03260 [Lewinellaceae bacterium]|nr:hypothetical protein [Lewinellaceae bacterium]